MKAEHNVLATTSFFEWWSWRTSRSDTVEAIMNTDGNHYCSLLSYKLNAAMKITLRQTTILRLRKN